MAERRRRRIVTGGDDPPVGDDARTGERTAAAPAPASRGRRGEEAALTDEATPWPGADPEPANAERGLRGLVGGGSSQVSPAAAMRARDAARPSADDLARSEAELHIVRRHWTPRD
jgi:hypothetical protein